MSDSGFRLNFFPTDYFRIIGVKDIDKFKVQKQ